MIELAALAKSWLATLGMMAGQGAVLVIVALVITRAGRLRPAWQAAIWLVVALELALPWRPAMPWSLSDLIASFSDRSGDAAVVIAAAPMTVAPPMITWTTIGWLLLGTAWAVGALVMLTRALSAQHRTWQAARRAPLAPAHVQVMTGRRARVVVGDEAVGPHVVGLFRPIIVVPPALVEDHQLLRAALLHELAHVRRRDAIGRFIQIIASSLMWWFPLMRVVNRRLDLAREAACDAWALETADIARPAYARLLVRMAALRAAAAPALAVQHSLDARVAAVLGPPARARMGIVYRLVLVAWMLVALGGARTAAARGHEEVCRYTPQMAEALYTAYPQADLDGDGQLSRDEACDLQAELANASRRSPEPEPEVATLLAEPLCCNCDEAEVYSSLETASCSKVEGADR